MYFFRLLSVEFLKYTCVSAVAFCVDFGFFLFCFRFLEFSVYLAATIGFIAGSVVAYSLSLKHVFSFRAYSNDQRKEFLLFFLVGVFGLMVTNASLYVFVELSGINAEVSRIASAAITLLFNYMCRKLFLFSSRSLGVKV